MKGVDKITKSTDIEILCKIVSLLKRKQRLMLEILQITSRMVGTVEDVDLFSSLLNTRQQYMDKISQLDEKLINLKKNISIEKKDSSAKDILTDWSNIKRIYPEQWEQIEVLLIAIRNVLMKCDELTKQCQSLAVDKLKKIESDVCKIKTSKKVLDAYSDKKKQPDGIFVDKKK